MTLQQVRAELKASTPKNRLWRSIEVTPLRAEDLCTLGERIVELHAQEPTTPEGAIERDAVIHELNNLIFSLQIEALNALHQAQQEAGLQ